VKDPNKDLPKAHHPSPEERDERVSLAPLDPEEALRGLLAVETEDDDEQSEDA
jgi:hypothetical protein